MSQPHWLLRIEGAVVFGVSVFAYHALHGNWWLFALLLFTPDIFMLGYLLNKDVGATLYNVGHTYSVPLLLSVGLMVLHRSHFLWLPVIWIAHIGWDRFFDYGFKYKTAFRDTHLQRV